MSRIRMIGVLTTVFVLFMLPALAQNIITANQGKPGNQGPWPVTTSSSASAHGACVNTTMNVGTTGTACPATASTTRGSILIELVQTGETLTVTSDGATAATATVGIQVSDTGTYRDNLVGTVSTNCRCSAATCSVRIVECP